MASFHRFRSGFRFMWVPVFLACGFLLLACSGGGGEGGAEEGPTTGGTGVIALDLRIEEDGIQRLQRQMSGADFDCEANGIVTIEVIVYNEFGGVIAIGGPWECESGEGFIADVEAGIDRIVVALAKDESGATIFRGEVVGVVVRAGETTEIGPVFLIPVLNRRPVLDAIGPMDVSEGDTLEFLITANDPDADNRLTFSASNLPPGATFDSANRFFRWTPAFGDAGIYSVLFGVTDDGEPPLSDSESVTIAVGNVNRPPILEPIEDKTVKAGEPLEFMVTATDPDGDALTYQASDLPKDNLFDPATGVFRWTPDFEDAGNYLVLFTVTDDGEPPRSDTEEVRITVGAVNRPPEFDPIGDQKVDEGDLLEFRVTAIDPDDDILTFEAVELPEGAGFDSRTQAFRWRTGFEDAGNHKAVFKVTDDGDPLLSDTAEVTISVGPGNQPPMLDPIGDKTVNLALFDGFGSLGFPVAASDPDGDNLTISATGLPIQGIESDGTFNPSTRQFEWPIIVTNSDFGSDEGSYSIGFTVTDPGNLSDSKSILIRVVYNNPPVIESILHDQTSLGGDPETLLAFPGSPVSLFVEAFDPDRDMITYSANGPSGSSFDPATGDFQWIPSQADLGSTYTLLFTVQDDGDPRLSDSQEVIVSVRPFIEVFGQIGG